MRFKLTILTAGLVLAGALAGAARADVVTADNAGFQIHNTVTINSTPDKVYAALLKVGQWWNPEHTWSGKSSNLRLQARAGGCFCEKLDGGGSAQHMVVIYAAPGRELRLSGALGPLQTEAATGVLILSLNPKDDATELNQTYTVGGWTKGGWGPWAPDVDAVLLDQITRLKTYVETGKPPQQASP